MSKKPATKLKLRSMGGGKYEVFTPFTNGLAVPGTDGWELSPNLRSMSDEAKDAIVRRLDESESKQG